MTKSKKQVVCGKKKRVGKKHGVEKGQEGVGRGGGGRGVGGGGGRRGGGGGGGGGGGHRV